MADLQIQTRLRRCCREVLEKLDKARGHLVVAPAARLAVELGEVPLDPAVERARGCFTPRDHRGVRVAEVCTKLCGEHARAHRDAGEDAEAELWQILTSTLREPKDP